MKNLFKSNFKISLVPLCRAQKLPDEKRSQCQNTITRTVISWEQPFVLKNGWVVILLLFYMNVHSNFFVWQWYLCIIHFIKGSLVDYHYIYIIILRPLKIVNKYIGYKAIFVLSTSLLEQGLLFFKTVMEPFSTSGFVFFLYFFFILAILEFCQNDTFESVHEFQIFFGRIHYFEAL